MEHIFSPESPVFQFINKLFLCAWLNILWFVCCLPIFTIGASTTALFYVTLKMIKNEEGNVTRQFFTAFKANFKKATIIWLILLVFGIILGIDGYVLYHLHSEGIFWTICSAVIIAVIIVYLIILMNIFPLLSRFENTIKAMFINSFIMGVRYLFCSILMAVIYFVMLFVIINIFTPAIVFGEGLCALLCSYLLSNILVKLENTSTENS